MATHISKAGHSSNVRCTQDSCICAMLCSVASCGHGTQTTSCPLLLKVVVRCPTMLSVVVVWIHHLPSSSHCLVPRTIMVQLVHAQLAAGAACLQMSINITQPTAIVIHSHWVLVHCKYMYKMLPCWYSALSPTMSCTCKVLEGI